MSEVPLLARVDLADYSHVYISTQRAAKGFLMAELPRIGWEVPWKNNMSLLREIARRTCPSFHPPHRSLGIFCRWVLREF